MSEESAETSGLPAEVSEAAADAVSEVIDDHERDTAISDLANGVVTAEITAENAAVTADSAMVTAEGSAVLSEVAAQEANAASETAAEAHAAVGDVAYATAEALGMLEERLAALEAVRHTPPLAERKAELEQETGEPEAVEVTSGKNGKVAAGEPESSGYNRRHRFGRR